MRKGPQLWRLVPRANEGVVLRSDLDYFATRFIGLPMEKGWQPPPIRVSGARRPLADFLSWMLTAPVVSQRAAQSLAPLIEPHAEILPLITLRGAKYYALNVVSLVKGLDLKASGALWAPDEPHLVLGVDRYVFGRNAKLTAPIFKAAECPGGTLVTRAFIQAVESLGLTGVRFADATVPTFAELLAEQSARRALQPRRAPRRRTMQ